MNQKFSIAYVTDRGLFLPTLLSAHSALRRASQPLRLLFLGSQLEIWMWRAVEALQKYHTEATIESVNLPPEWLPDARGLPKHITPTTCGRMFLPRITKGRVLYIDGDTLISGDVSKAASIDLGKNPIGGVRDFAVMRWKSKGKVEPLERQAKSLGGDFDVSNYINGGVILMDCDAIAGEPGLQGQMEDVSAAIRYPAADQDHINALFRGRITHLDPSWNSSWGRSSLQRRDCRGLEMAGRSAGDKILHFHGPNKPWNALRVSNLRKGALATLRYRREMSHFNRLFPNLGG